MMYWRLYDPSEGFSEWFDEDDMPTPTSESLTFGQYVEHRTSRPERLQQVWVSDITTSNDGDVTRILPNINPTPEELEANGIPQDIWDDIDQFHLFQLRKKLVSNANATPFIMKVVKKRFLETVPLFREGKTGKNWCAVLDFDESSNLKRAFLEYAPDPFYYKIKNKNTVQKM